MKKVKIAIIGIGNMGSSHAKNLVKGAVKGGELVAVCDINPERLKWAKENLGDSIKLFDNADTLFESKIADAIIIATPHYLHPVLAIKGFNHGLHVLTEKPAGVYTKQVREMNDVASKSNKVFGIMYNQRTNPVYQKMKSLIEEGEIGEITRINWIITTWYRTQAYYNSGDWRASWAGEGGGVLLNQCPHQLDLLQWICGMPKRVRAFASIGKYHDIEVEDDVTAYLEYENGASGIFTTTTGTALGTNRLEITGDTGKLLVENNKLSFWKSRVPISKFTKEATEGFCSPEIWKCEVPIKGDNLQHIGILRNFVSSILNGTKLLAPGEDGIKGLTLSNAMYLSSWTDNWVELPIDEDLFYEKLQEKIKNSSYKNQY